MTLIKSISGIRGTIGGKVGEGLTPLDAVLFAAAYGSWLKTQHPSKKLKVVIGRDSRISGQMISDLVSSTLIGLGIDVVNLGLSTTPMYLLKAGLCAEKTKDYEAATTYYTRILDDYPAYGSQKTIEKYIARTSTIKKK